jgi:crotonobetaine/carnitine-CoA ligase
MGRASSSYRVRIVDDSGTPLLRPGIGLLEVLGVRGVSVMSGSLEDDEATAAAFTSDGWLRTGDRVELHDDGWFSFIERDKDMLKIGGENVAALEIERVISAVRGVDEVAVVAGPDPMLDEVPVAFVIAAGDADGLEDDIIETCRTTLADFKVPRLVVVVGELPRSTLNKVAKNKLRVEAAARLRARREMSEEVRS